MWIIVFQLKIRLWCIWSFWRSSPPSQGGLIFWMR